MGALTLSLTNAGLAAIVAANGTASVVIAQVGLTASAFITAPTLTALPGEHTRLAAVSGQAVDDRTVHLTARDESSAGYTVRGIGLYLSNGTLFAVYGQSTPIFEKSPISTYLQAIDIRFDPNQAATVTFGNTNFIYPPATEMMKGVVQRATQAETDAGTDDEHYVSPLKLGARLATVIAALTGRQILTAGLATGGGNLSVDRTISVPAASVAEADAGAIATKALTPASLANILAGIASRAFASRQLIGGGLATGGGDLTADRTIVVTAATAAEADGGAIATKAVTPASLVNILGSIAARAFASRQVIGGGLATGGGDLAADRTISVAAASATEADGGAIATKALTPASLVNILASIAGRALASRQLLGAGLATGGGDFTADRTITVAPASAPEADAGLLNTKAVTPASLVNILGSIAARALASRQVLGAGLASGGGDLTADRTIAVTAASPAEADAGAVTTKALTPASLANILGRLATRADSATKVWGGGLAVGGGDISVDRTITVLAASTSETEAGAIGTKAVTPASLATVLMGIAGKASSATKVWGGGLATGGGDISADRTITVTAAAASEADAGVLTTKALTPASLVNVLSTIAGKASSATKVWGGGLATGGGDMSADRTITVAKASAADVAAGASDNAAITPAALAGSGYVRVSNSVLAVQGRRVHADGFVEMWGTLAITGGSNVSSTTLAFDVPFPNACFGICGNADGPANANWQPIVIQFRGLSVTGAIVVSDSAKSDQVIEAGKIVRWRAWGN